jgi:large subunit ribosomal protein L5
MADEEAKKAAKQDDAKADAKKADKAEAKTTGKADVKKAGAKKAGAKQAGKADAKKTGKADAKKAGKADAKKAGGKKGDGKKADDKKKAPAKREPIPEPKLRALYNKEIMGALKKRFDYTNVHAIPRLQKICVNMGVGDAVQNAKFLEAAQGDLEAIVGQKPSTRRAKKAVSNFKLREGMPIGCMVTLRGTRMYEFLERLISVAIPRIRDFRGLPPRSFDGKGNYTFGIKEQIIFPEVKYDKVEKIRGMDITLATSAKTDEEGYELLKALGMPFRER